MKRTIQYITGLLFLLSCNSNKQENELTGNWYSCSYAKNGDYIEMFVKENQYRYSSNFGTVTPWSEFKISGDTLIQFDKHSTEDSLITNKAIIEFVDKKQIRLDYLTSDETWVFYKINETIKDNLIDSEILRETMRRSREIKCDDTRTDEEKRKDSLLKEINFQF